MLTFAFSVRFNQKEVLSLNGLGKTVTSFLFAVYFIGPTTATAIFVEVASQPNELEIGRAHV